jgi:hypothetical protein
VGSYSNWPDFSAWLATAWGSGQEWSCAGPGSPWGVGNLAPGGTNPAYTLDDFYSIYPVWFGQGTTLSNCAATAGSATIDVPSTAGLAYGQFVQCAGVLPPGSVIVGVGVGTITVNQAAITATATATLTVYEAPLIPTAVVKTYLNLAYASLNQALWQDTWWLAMGLYIAHYCTLWASTSAVEMSTAVQNVLHGEAPQPAAGDLTGTLFTVTAAPPGGALSLYRAGLLLATPAGYSLVGTSLTLTTAIGSDALYATWFTAVSVTTQAPQTAAQAAAAGLAVGITTSESVGDVSVGYQVLDDLKNWGAWQLTKFGQQLATLAKVIGSGPMVLW